MRHVGMQDRTNPEFDKIDFFSAVPEAALCGQLKRGDFPFQSQPLEF